MSKLYTKYLELKKQSTNIIYLFKSGIFFLALQEDAEKLSSELGLKITNLSPNVTKCGFPISRQEHYFRLLEAKNIDFTIVDEKYGMVENYSDYMNNSNLKLIIDKIIGLDFDNITYKEAYEILLSASNSFKKIYDNNSK